MIVVTLRGQGKQEIREAVRAELERDPSGGPDHGLLRCFDRAGRLVAEFPLADVLTYRVQ